MTMEKEKKIKISDSPPKYITISMFTFSKELEKQILKDSVTYKFNNEKQTEMKNLTKEEKKVAVMVLREYVLKYKYSLDDFIKEHNLDPVEIEVGKVYRSIDPEIKGVMMFVTSKDYEKMTGYGFGSAGWKDLDHWMITDQFTEATPEEWKAALIEEAKRRGIVGAAKKIKIGNKEYELKKHSDDCTFQLIGDIIFYQGAVIMYKGKWAEIISNPVQEQIAKLKAELEKLEKLV